MYASILSKSNAIGYDVGTDTSTLTDTSASLTADALVGMYLNPDVTQTSYYWITPNTSTSITVTGDITSVAVAGYFYDIVDKFRLQPGSPALTAGSGNTEIGAYGGGGDPALYVSTASPTPTTAGSLTQDEIWE